MQKHIVISVNFSHSWHIFENNNNTAQRASSIIYQIYIYNLWLTPELSTLNLVYACWCHKRALRKNSQSHLPKVDSSP